MRLEDIGFYTLSDARVRGVSATSPMWRGEIVLLDDCNFRCPYCRGLRDDCAGTMPVDKAKRVLDLWAKDGLRNVRFSGGEPTLHPDIGAIVAHAKALGVGRIAISTNGSGPPELYGKLVSLGANDFSVSLDACCSSVGHKMCGGVAGAWERAVDNIRRLAKLTYVTVGMVFTPENMPMARESIVFAHSLGVADIRIISSAQYDGDVAVDLPDEVVLAHPILRYRVHNSRIGIPLRGISECDYHRCPLVLDDSAIAGDFHFPCIIYLREQGDPIGRIGPDMRHERIEWFEKHNCLMDPICKKNCLDVCVAHSNKFEKLRVEHELPKMDPTQFGWLEWIGGGFSEFMGFPARLAAITSETGKREIRKYAVGWCHGEELACRSKVDEMAVMFHKDGEARWFHMRKYEFVEVFGRIREPS